MNVRALCLGSNYVGTGADLAQCLYDRDRMVAWITRHSPAAVITEGSDLDYYNTVEALEDFVASLTADTFGIISYSGHGSHLPDEAGGDEPDGRDECWITGELKPLRDDVINNILAKAQGPLVVYSDSCFSGTVTRAMVERATLEGIALKRRYYPSESPTPQAPVMGRIGAVGVKSPVLLMSGCSDTQYSYETSGNSGLEAGGVFTTTLLATYVPGMTFRDVHRAIRQKLPNASFPQSPRLFPSRNKMRSWPVFPA